MWRPAVLRQAADIVTDGGLIAYPTEAVYGLGCLPGYRDAVLRLCRLKQRPLRAGLILLAAEAADLAGWIDPGEREWARLLSAQDKPTTWIMRAGPLAADWVTGGRPTLAVRLSRHAPATRLCQLIGGPLVSTSANRRGRPPARDALTVRRLFGRDIDYLLGGPTGGWAEPSVIRDAATGRVLRGA